MAEVEVEGWVRMAEVEDSGWPKVIEEGDAPRESFGTPSATTSTASTKHYGPEQKKAQKKKPSNHLLPPASEPSERVSAAERTSEASRAEQAKE